MKDSHMKRLNSASEVVDLIGGTNEVATLTAALPSSVSNWRNHGFPPDTFVVMMNVLTARGAYAPPSLWGMRMPKRNGKRR
jgi:hypothetical protein